MYTFRYGGKLGKQYSLSISNDQIVVRTTSRIALLSERPFEAAPVSAAARDLLGNFQLVTAFRDAGVEILQAKVGRGAKSLRDRSRAALTKEPEIEFAGRVLIDPQGNRPVIYTENFFIKFDSEQSATACRKVLKRYRLEIKRELEYARNAYFVAAPEDTGLKIFEIAKNLLQEPSSRVCHPELIREARQRAAFHSSGTSNERPLTARPWTRMRVSKPHGR